MKLKGNTIESNVIGLPLLTFNENLTDDAKKILATKIEHMDAIFNHVEILLKDAHIRAVLENMESLQKTYKEYQEHLLVRSRKNKKEFP